jgi:hypothetical protein
LQAFQLLAAISKEIETMQPRQLHFWDWQTVRAAHLEVVDRSRPVFYRICVEASLGAYRVRKESGVEAGNRGG